MTAGQHDHGINGGVTITLQAIYETQQQMLITLAEIQGTLALQSQQDRNDKAIIVDHETRIRKIETKVYALPATSTVLAIAALLMSWFGVPGS